MSEGHIRIFWWRQGRDGDGNPAGVEMVREGERGRVLTYIVEGEARKYQYAGTETDDARVGG